MIFTSFDLLCNDVDPHHLALAKNIYKKELERIGPIIQFCS